MSRIIREGGVARLVIIRTHGPRNMGEAGLEQNKGPCLGAEQKRGIATVNFDIATVETEISVRLYFCRISFRTDHAVGPVAYTV